MNEDVLRTRRLSLRRRPHLLRNRTDDPVSSRAIALATFGVAFPAPPAAGSGRSSEVVLITPRLAVIGLVFLLVAVTVHTADAQDNPLYAGVSGMWSMQGATTASAPDIPSPGVGGMALGVAGEFGRFLKPKVNDWTLSLAFEFSIPARFDAVQSMDYTVICSACLTDNQHRDLVFSGLFHVHLPPTGPIRVGVVAGPSIIQEDTLQRTAYSLAPRGTVFGPFGPETQLTRWTVGLTIGADIGIQVSRQIQIVPQIRLHWVNRTDDLESSASYTSALLGLGSWLIRPAVGVRVGF
jgi:hypothetical protein